MKLKDAYLSRDVYGMEDIRRIKAEYELTPMVMDLLKDETTEEEIVDIIHAEVDRLPSATAEQVGKIIEALRGIGALEE